MIYTQNNEIEFQICLKTTSFVLQNNLVSPRMLFLDVKLPWYFLLIFLITKIRSWWWPYGDTKSSNMIRSSHPEVFYRKGALTNFTKFLGKHLCQSLFFNKVTDLRPATLLKKRLWHRYFPVNFGKFLRTPFSTEHLRWLLLYDQFRPISSVLLAHLVIHYSYPVDTVRLFNA